MSSEEDGPVRWDDGIDWNTPVMAWTLRDELPDLAYLSWMQVDAPHLFLWQDRPSGHLLNEWLRGNGCFVINDVLELTEDEIEQWPHFGPAKREKLVSYLRDLNRNALPILAEYIEAQVETPRLLNPELVQIATWAQHHAGAFTWGDVETALAEGPVPDDVAADAAELRQVALDLGAGPATARDQLQLWLDQATERDHAILQGRFLRTPAQTLDEIGRALEVTRERVRQLETRLRDELLRDLSSDEWRTVRWAIHRLHHEIGSYAPPSVTDQDGSRSHQLLMWLADYTTTDEVLVRHGFRLPHSSELTMMAELGPPVVDEDDLRSTLTSMGVAASHLDWAVESIPGTRRIHGQLVTWSRNQVENAYAVLMVHNSPMTVEEIISEFGETASVRSLRQRLFEDPRMCRVTRGTIGLRAWGGEEYTSITEAMIAVLEERGEAIELKELAFDLAARFAMNVSSITAYSAAPVFVIEHGRLRLRSPDEPYSPRATPHKVAGLYRATPDVVLWNIDADHDLMRGSGRTVPPEVATFVGVVPGSRQLMTNPARDVPISWLETSHVGPNIGSLKALAVAAGAEQGDHLIVRFHRSTRAITVEVSPEQPQGPTIVAQLQWHTGLPEAQCRDRQALAQAVHTSPDVLHEVLAARGEGVVAGLAAQLA